MTQQELYNHCIKAEKELEQVARGLAPLDEQAAEGVGQMANVVRKICDGLAKSMKDTQPDEEPEAVEDTANEPDTIEGGVRNMVARRRAAREPE